MFRISIVHFAPLEKYPPVMNDILDLDLLDINILGKVYTSGLRQNWFTSKKIDIHRIGKESSCKPLLRYLQYLKFNVSVFLELLKLNPSHILCYETLSVWPVFFFSLINRKVRVHIHYHEYTSLNEINNSSKYYKLLHLLEKKIWLKKNVSISHTNKDRKLLFLKDNPLLSEEKIKVFPNLPPKDWYKQSKKLRTVKKKSPNLKLVHVGAVGLESTFVIEVIEWVVAQEGRCHLDFYISNTTGSTEQYLKTISAKYPFVKIFDTIQYYDLPKILSIYDIGLVMYKGHIPNYVYNVPNKVFEYLICGLEVWFSHKLISTKTLVDQHGLTQCKEIDFQKINTVKISKCNYKENDFYFHNQQSYSKIKNLLI